MKGTDIILAPITNMEKQELINMNMNDKIVLLYRTESSNDIQIGMLSTILRECFPKLANLDKIKFASEVSFFILGNDENVLNITDRPVYLIKPTKERTVEEYRVINGSLDNNLNVWLEDILDGEYKMEDSFSFRNIM